MVMISVPIINKAEVRAVGDSGVDVGEGDVSVKGSSLAVAMCGCILNWTGCELT